MKSSERLTNLALLARSIESKFDEVLQLVFDIHFSADLTHEFEVQLPDAETLIDLKKSHLKPMFRVLIDAIKRDSIELTAIYFDERLRYAPHQKPPDDRCTFHSRIVEQESKALAALFDSEEIGKMWREFHLQLLRTPSKSPVSILAVGDCLLNEVRVFISMEGATFDVDIDFRCMYFSSSSEGGTDVKGVLSHIENYKTDIIALSFFTFDAMPGFRRFFENSAAFTENQIDNACMEFISRVRLVLTELAKKFDGTILVHGVSGLPLSRKAKYVPMSKPFTTNQQVILLKLNEYLNELIIKFEQCLFLDEFAIGNQEGFKVISREVAPQRKYKGMFHTSYFGDVLAKRYAQIAKAYQVFSKAKLLLLDFDNTLWNGVIGDGEVVHHRARQKILKSLKAKGLMLAALSKNTPANIRWAEMTLQPEDFAIVKINWNPKSESIQQIQSELNLGLDSFIFIDDNRHERSLVSEALPEVVCLDAQDQRVWEYLGYVSAFPCARETDESKTRTEMYRQQSSRAKAQRKVGNDILALKKLGLWYKFSVVKKDQMPRVHELVSRTNQFNTTTKRYSKKQLEEYRQRSDAEIYVAKMGDNYGSLGLVAVVIVLEESKYIVLDSFVMSCRAIGFGLEKQILFEIGKRYTGILRGLYQPTDRNSPCALIYSEAGLKKVGNSYWEGDLGSLPLQPITWLNSI